MSPTVFSIYFVSVLVADISVAAGTSLSATLAPATPAAFSISAQNETCIFRHFRWRLASVGIICYASCMRDTPNKCFSSRKAQEITCCASIYFLLIDCNLPKRGLIFSVKCRAAPGAYRKLWGVAGRLQKCGGEVHRKRRGIEGERDT